MRSLLTILTILTFSLAQPTVAFSGEVELVTSKQASTILNINQASIPELAKLPGIGKKKAASIVKYREKVGEIKSIDELKKVKGIGEKLALKLQDKVVF